MFRNDGLHLNEVGSARLRKTDGHGNSQLLAKKLRTREGTQWTVNIHATTTTRHAGTSANVNIPRRKLTTARNARKRCYISFLYTNARSLIPKRNEFSAYAATEKQDVVAIIETWGNSTHLVSELSLPGYEIFQKNRANKKGGRIIVYVKRTVVAIKVDKQDAENDDSVYVDITHNNKKLILATVYRPPKLQAADDTALYNEIQSLIQSKNLSHR